jgi:hypothetical protein
MKRHFFFVCILLVSLSLSAQQLHVMSVTGKVYQVKEQDNKQQRLRLLPGLAIDKEGVLELYESAEIEFLHGGNTLTLKDPGKYEISRLVSGSTQKPPGMNFSSRFLNFINEGLNHSNSAVELEKHYRKHMENATGGTQGFGEKDYPVLAINPLSGYLSGGQVMFTWYACRDSNSAAGYAFELIDSRNNQLLYKAIIKDTFHILDLDQLLLEEEEVYDWKVTAMPKESVATPLSSPDIPFLIRPMEWASMQKRLESIPLYNSANPSRRTWMEALMLEREKYIYEAYIRLQKLTEKEPDNLLVRKLFATFLARHGLVKRAENILKK